MPRSKENRRKVLTKKGQKFILSSTVEMADFVLVEDNSDRRPQVLSIAPAISTVHL